MDGQWMGVLLFLQMGVLLFVFRAIKAPST